jgi:thiol-disulfide isomerase/thioredoxin
MKITTRTLHPFTALVVGCLLLVGCSGSSDQSNVYTVPLTYSVPGEGPQPDFTPTGFKVELNGVPSDETLPPGAVHPARYGLIPVGPTQESWIPMLLTATSDEPGVLTQLYIDMNRNGDFSDDGPPSVASSHHTMTTRGGFMRYRFPRIELSVRFTEPERTEPYIVDFWLIHWDGNPEPDSFIRYAGASWRSGSVTINGIPALVMAMDFNNDALYDGPEDHWGVVEASMPDASKQILSWQEAKFTDRLMFLQRDSDATDLVLKFRSFAIDGSSITFEVVDYPISKAEDRYVEEFQMDGGVLEPERQRARATTPYVWTDELDGAMAAALASNKRVFLYFDAEWCGPCKVMDEWIWTDAEVVDVLRNGYTGVKLDFDANKVQEVMDAYKVMGIPGMLIVDPVTGNTTSSTVGYQTSQQMLDFLRETKD